MEVALVIGLVWPEPNSSAAGYRMLKLLQILKEQGYRIVFASSAQKSQFSASLTEWVDEEAEIKLNDNSFDQWVKDLNPNLVLYDRFLTEEQFGWRLRENCPEAINVLDTEDLHFLRRARHESVKKTGSCDEVNIKTRDAIREVSSILRCDLTIMISEYEIKLLQEEFMIPPSMLIYLPFLHNGAYDEVISFSERKDFVFIGNFLHEPNKDAVLYLRSIWPKIRKRLPHAKLHIYGAYPMQQILEIHDEKLGFFVHGRAENAKEVISNARVLIAPIRFGAGLKGKLFEAMKFGTPSLTTNIGAEAMVLEDGTWGGLIANTSEEIIEKCVVLYSDEKVWEDAQYKAKVVLKNRFYDEQFSQLVIATIENIKLNLAKHRRENFWIEISNFQMNNSTKYLSKWREAKNN